MTSKLLTGRSALSGLAALTQPFCQPAPRNERTSKGWIAEALDMLRADVTNVDYLVHGFCRR